MNFPMTEYVLPELIGLIGAAGHGKSTSAHILGELGYVRLPLAAPLKNMLKAGFGLTDKDMSDAHKEKADWRFCGHSPRYALQTLGTEWGREFLGENLWLNAWQATREAIGARYVVIDDVRFYNEMQMVHDLGGVLLEITRPGHGYIKSSEHPSEVEWARHRDMVDWTVINDGDGNTLRSRLEKALYGVSEKVPAETVN